MVMRLVLKSNLPSIPDVDRLEELGRTTREDAQLEHGFCNSYAHLRLVARGAIVAEDCGIRLTNLLHRIIQPREKSFRDELRIHDS